MMLVSLLKSAYNYCTFFRKQNEGRLSASLFTYLSAGVVEWATSCFATTLLHDAPPKVTPALVLYVIFGGLFLLIGI